MVYAGSEQDSFFGNMSSKTVSEATQQKVDAEIRRILDEQYAIARKLLEDNRDKVEAMTAALLEWETIDAEQINDIMAGQPPRAPKPSQASNKAAKGDNGTTGSQPTVAPQPAAKN
jgi:cell division protease FtsH